MIPKSLLKDNEITSSSYFSSLVQSFHEIFLKNTLNNHNEEYLEKKSVNITINYIDERD